MLNETFWRNYFRVYDSLNQILPYRQLLLDIKKALELKYTDVVLDLGSGTGNLMMELKGECKEIIGIDFSREGINIHRKKDPLAKLIIADITKPLPFGNNYFSKVVSNNVIYTLNKQQQVALLLEAWRILIPGGKLVISNVKKDFSPGIIYKNHLLKSVKSKGFFNTLTTDFTLALANIKILYFNKKIKENGGQDNYHFLSELDQADLLKLTGFIDISLGKDVYAGQAIMHSAYKI